MRVVFMGTPDFTVAALRRLHSAHEIVAVYTQPPRPAGRGQAERPSPVQVYAEGHLIPVHAPASLKAPDVQQAFAALAADVAVVAAYGLILPKAVLAAPRRGCLNIHASLLPRWRGAAPIQRAIIAGDRESGITIMQMEAGLDTGPMLLKRAVPITNATTAGELHDALAELGGELIIEALARLSELTPEIQPDAGICYAAKIEKSEAHIDFTRPARDVVRQIHGLSPSPGAWFARGEERIKVLRAVVEQGDGKPGTVLDNALTIACGSGAVRPTTLQRGGRGATDVEAFLRGYALPQGTKLA